MGLLLFLIGYSHGKDAADGRPEDDVDTAAGSGEEAIEKGGGMRNTRDKVGGVRCGCKMHKLSGTLINTKTVLRCFIIYIHLPT